MNVIKQKSLWLSLALIIFIVDQVTKNWAAGVLTYSESQAFLPFFNFTLLHNYGAAFSFLSDAGGWQRWFFGIVAFAVSIFLLVWIVKLEPRKKIELAGLSCILGGALGNLYDRIVLGYVIDFVDWFYPIEGSVAESCLPFFYGRPEFQTCHWPAFNIADSAILLGVGLLIIDMLFLNQEQSQEK